MALKSCDGLAITMGVCDGTSRNENVEGSIIKNLRYLHKKMGEIHFSQFSVQVHTRATIQVSYKAEWLEKTMIPLTL